MRERAIALWEGLWPAPLRSAIVRYRTWILATAFFVATFLIYRALSPDATPYNNFVRLGDAFLHGRIYFPEDVPYLELIIIDGRYYVIPPPWPAIIMLPGVLLYGLALNQTLVSVVIGAINASTVTAVVSSLRAKLSAQFWFTVLLVFGTVYFYAATDGGVWFFSHTVAVLFVFFAIYATLVKKWPLVAGLCLGAAYWTRQPTILALPFFVIMLSDRWLLPAEEGKPLWKRVNPEPLLRLGIGLGFFVVLSFIYNYMRFSTPLDASQHRLPERVLAQPWFNHGPFDYRYIPRHTQAMFEFMPILKKEAPYILPSWAGTAIWFTSPALLYAFFAGVKDKLAIVFGGVLLAVTCSFIMLRQVGGLYGWDWITFDIPSQINLFPFFFMIPFAIYFGRHDKFILACWSAILPIALMLGSFAGTGFSQFGYRFSLDFMPFLFLLTMKGMGTDLKWHHKLFIVLSVVGNLWGVLWIHQFEMSHYLDLTWVQF